MKLTSKLQVGTVVLLLVVRASSLSGQESVIHSFANDSVDGFQPEATLLIDSKGNLFGTTAFGGSSPADGAVFEVSPAGEGWTEKVIHSFNRNDTTANAYSPSGGLIADSEGNLYGLTSSGGSAANGTVFELSPGTDGSWTEKVIYSFGSNPQDGSGPVGNLVFDAKGNLYGATVSGGTNSAENGNTFGTVFELSPSTGGGWTEKILYNFGATSTDGVYPEAGLTIDPAGNLYGTTMLGGAHSDRSSYGGTVFELIRGESGTWSETILHDFYPTQSGGDGSVPKASLLTDSKGNLYGTTQNGGYSNAGTVFELSPTTSGPWTEKILYLYTSSASGYGPTAGLTSDFAGNLYGTTYAGGVNARPTVTGGTVFKLTPVSGGTWTETFLHDFPTPTSDGSTSLDGNTLVGGVTFDSKGNLYGTTEYGGAHAVGTVFEINAVAPPPALSLAVTPTDLAFASLSEGATSPAQTITLKNTGTAAITLGAISFTGTNPKSFVLSSKSCTTTLAPSASCTLSVEFAPQVTGSLSASLNIADNATGSPQLVTLKGTATAAGPTYTLAISPTTLTFASLPEGQTSPAQTITLKNTGSAAITFGATTFTGTNPKSFVKSATTCAASLAAAASCTISIQCKPTVTGELSAALSIADNATGSPQLVTLKGTATATGPTYTIAISPTTLTFASLPEGSTSPAQTITLKNTGTAAITLGATTFTGSNPKSFVVSSKTCTNSLAPAASCTLSIESKPAVTGTLSATLNIADNATGSPQLVTLKGAATSAAPTLTAAVSPASLTFASTTIGSASAAQIVTLKNTGTGALTLGTTTFTGTNPKSFVVSAKTCSTTLPAGASCTLSIECKPAVTGSLSASLNIPSNATDSPQLVTLKGAATAAAK